MLSKLPRVGEEAFIPNCTLQVCLAECLASSQPSAPASCLSRLELPFEGASQAQATSLTPPPDITPMSSSVRR